MKLSHKYILQANVGIFTGLLVLLSFVFSFVEIEIESTLRLWADFATKLVLGFSLLFFVGSIVVIMNYNLKDDVLKLDQKTSTSKKNFVIR